MTTAAEYQVLSTPTVYVDGELIAVVPESVKQSQPGERSVRAMSAGGNAAVAVVGLNAEQLKGRVTFSVALTAANVARVEDWLIRATGWCLSPSR